MAGESRNAARLVVLIDAGNAQPSITEALLAEVATTALGNADIGIVLLDADAIVIPWCALHVYGGLPDGQGAFVAMGLLDLPCTCGGAATRVHGEWAWAKQGWAASKFAQVAWGMPFPASRGSAWFIGRVTARAAGGYDVPHGGQHPCGRAASLAAAGADASGDPGGDRQAGFGRAG